MKTIKNFFITIRDTFYNPLFYSRIKNIDGSYPVILVIAVSLISSAVLMTSVLPSMLNIAESINTDEIKNYFPVGLEITVKDGQAISNKDGQYYFGELPRDNQDDVHAKTYAVLVDTTSEYTLADLKEADAYFIITKDAFLGEEDGDLRLYYFAEIFQDRELTLNREIVSGWIDKIKELTTPLVWLLYIFAIGFLSIVFSIGWFILALVFSIVTMLIGSLRKREMKYGEVYKITLYALVPLMIVGIFAPLLPVIIKFIMFLVVLIANITAGE